MKKSKRTGFSWPAEFKGGKKEQIDSLRRALGPKGEKELGNRPMFFLALLFAYTQGIIDDEVPPRQTNSARLSELSEKHFQLLEAIAVEYAGNKSVLEDPDAVFDIAERYVSAGIKALVKEHQKNQAFRSWLSSKIYQRLRNSQAPRDISQD
jgi:hypothetical protein